MINTCSFELDQNPQVAVRNCICYSPLPSIPQDKFPKSQIDVYVTVIEDDGGLLAACITAAGLAICHANIDVYDLIVGASLVNKMSYFSYKLIYFYPSLNKTLACSD